jgi:hypothetical protein
MRRAFFEELFGAVCGLLFVAPTCFAEVDFVFVAAVADLTERERVVGAAIRLRYHPASGEYWAASKENVLAHTRLSRENLVFCASHKTRRPTEQQSDSIVVTAKNRNESFAPLEPPQEMSARNEC